MQGKNTSILVVDDEEAICAVLEEHLTEEGYLVDSITDATEAVNLYLKKRHQLVISDIKMPHITGLDLIAKLKEYNPNLVSILVTGYASLQSAVSALREGVDDYLTKPFDLAEVSKAVDKALKKTEERNQSFQDTESLKINNRRFKDLADGLAQKVRTANRDLLRANYNLRKRIGELAIINEINTVVTSELSLDKLLNLCLELVSMKMYSQAASIMLVDEDDNLVVRAYVGPGDLADVIGSQIQIGQGVAGYVAKTGKPLLVKDIAEDERFAKDRIGDYESKSFICVPLLCRGKLLGVLDVTDKMNGQEYTSGDLNLLNTLARQVSVAIENAKLYKEMQDNCLAMVRFLADTLEAKDQYTSGHSLRVTEYAVAIARRYGCNDQEVNDLRYAGLLHDIGKVGIAEWILKKPDQLKEKEFNIVKQHPQVGEKIISRLGFLSSVRKIIRHHHENLDGTGYPDGLRGQDIPILTRIMKVADAFDAMTSNRPYRRALGSDKAIRELRKCSPGQFDPAVVSILEEEVLTGAVQME